jgi:hypothetical protein
VLPTFRKSKKTDWSVGPEIIVQIGKNTLYLESIVIIIMVIVGELIRNQAMGWTTEKFMFHSWQTREIFSLQWWYWRTNTSFSWVLVDSF